MRRNSLLSVVIGTIVGVILLVLFQSYLDFFRAWLTEDPALLLTRAGMVFGLLAMLLIAPLLALAVWLWACSSRILREERFPPSGVRVVRDTPILQGPAARNRATLFRVFAIVLVVAASGLSWLLWRVWVLVV